VTPREIVLANLAHEPSPRPGLDFHDGLMNDFVCRGVGASKTHTEKRWAAGEFEYYTDEWGNTWRRMVGGCQSGEVHEAAIKEWRDLDTLVLPDYDDPRRFEHIPQAFAEAPDRFHMAFVPGWVFASSRYLRKMEIYFMDLVLYRDELERLHRRVTDLFVNVIRRFAEAGAEGIFFCEDLGVQDRLLMSPEMWRNVFRLHYLRLTGTAHELGMKVFMHSCGYNWELIDDLIDAGIDVFQLDQPAIYDMPALAAKLRTHKRALHAPIDIQKVLPTGDRAFIEAEAERLVKTFEGALIVKSYGDLPGIGVEPEWNKWGYDAVLRAAGVENSTAE